MAVKTFTTEVLTSADTNTYLANSGLVYITSASATSGTALVFTSVFNSTYDNYRVIVTSMRSTTAAGMSIQLGTGTATNTGYYWGAIYLSAYTASPTVNTHGGSNASSMETAIVCGSSTDGGGIIEILNPNVAKNTMIINHGVDGRTDGSPRQTYSGWQSATTQFTSLHLNLGAGISNMVATVYGYRKA
jgi:hypothetical protein